MPTAIGVGISPAVGPAIRPLDLFAPTISGVAAGDWAPATLRTNTGGVARMTWFSGEAADSQAEVATRSDFVGSFLTTRDPALVTAHVHDVPGLLADTTYWFRPISRDAAGNSTTGATVSFTTAWTFAALTAAKRPNHWLDLNVDLVADRYPAGGLAALVDNATVQTTRDYSASALVFTNNQATQRPTFTAAGMNGAPALFFDGGDHLSTASAPAVLDYTGARWFLITGAIPDTSTATMKFMTRADTTTNTERWGFEANSTASSGKVSVFGDTKGSYQASTFAPFNTGVTFSWLWNRDALGNEDFLANWALHQTFTGMGNTAATGNARIGASITASRLLIGWINKIVSGPGYLDAGEIAAMAGYVG